MASQDMSSQLIGPNQASTQTKEQWNAFVNLVWNPVGFITTGIQYSFGKRYTVAYLNRPQNPKESRFSERDYGRFGCYFEYDLTEDHPLVVNYRVWLQDGEMTGEHVEALYQAFAHPPQVAVK